MDAKIDGATLVKLDRENFEVWRDQAGDLLEAHGLDELITAAYGPNDFMAGDTKQRQAKGRMFLKSTIGIADKALVSSCKTVKEILDLLTSSYKGSQSIHTLNTDFESLHWGMSTAEQFITKLNEIKAKMYSLNKLDQDDRFITKIVNEMPSLLSQVQAIYKHMIRMNEQVNYREFCDEVVQAYHDEVAAKNGKKERREAKQAADLMKDTVFYTQHERCEICHSTRHSRKYCPHNNQRPNYYPSRFDELAGRMNQQNREQNNSDGQRGAAPYRPSQKGQFSQQPPNWQNESGNRGQNSGYSGRFPEEHNSLNQPWSHRSNQSNQQWSSQPSKSYQAGQQWDGQASNKPQPNQKNQPNQSKQTGQSFFQQSGDKYDWKQREADEYEQRRQELMREYCNEFQDWSGCMFDEKHTDGQINFLDNCAPRHMVNQREFFIGYQPYPTPKPISGCGTGLAYGEGTVSVRSMVRGVIYSFKLERAYYMPSMPVNIISQVSARDKGMLFENCDKESEEFSYIYGSLNGKRVLTARRRVGFGGHFRINLRIEIQGAYLADTEWHEIMDHPPYPRLDRTSRSVDGMPLERTDGRKFSCIPCMEMNNRRRTFDHKLAKETVPGRFLHSDFAQLPKSSWRKSKHYVVFADEATGFGRIYFTPTLDEDQLIRAIDNCLADQNRDLGRLPALLHSDRGSNYMSQKVIRHLHNRPEPISTGNSTAYNHEQNGIAEKLIQDLQRMARVSLRAASAPESMFEEALRDACYKKNRLDRASLGCTPFEAYRGFKPNLAHIMKFGQRVMVHIPEERRASKKISKRGEEGRLVGHTQSTVNYRVANLGWTTVKELTGVKKIVQQPEQSSEIPMSAVLELMPPVSDEQEQPSTSESDDSEKNFEETGEGQDAEDQSGELPETDLSPEMPKSSQTPPIQRQNFEFSINEESVVIPRSVKEMLSSPYRDFWIEACDQEVMAWMAMKVGHLVPRSEVDERRILRAHWVFTVKANTEGKVTRFKGRYVIDGSAVPDSAFSPVINMTITRSMLVYALKRKMIVHLVDIKNAYLNSLLGETYYIEQIRLYEDPSKPNYVFKLDKSVYGLPQSAYNWYTDLVEHLLTLGLIQCQIDQCLFFLPALTLFILIHVDDLIMLAENERVMATYKKLISDKFQLTDRGEIRECLGTAYYYFPKHNFLFLNQEQKITELFREFEEYLPQPTELPIPSKVDLCKPSEKFENVFLFLSGLGSCNYIGHSTRADILIYVNKLSTFMRAPTKHHFQLLMKLIAYLYKTRKQHLKYTIDGYERPITVYADASAFGMELTKGRHTSGIVVELFGNPVQWLTRRQSVVTDEICNAELYALNLGLKQGLHIRNVLDELNLLEPNETVITIRGDNRSSAVIAEQGLKKNSTHYNNTLLHLRDFIQRGEAELLPVAGTANPADLLTKFLELPAFRKLTGLMNLKMVVGKQRSALSASGAVSDFK